jgi:hypothetical protein
MPRSRFTKEHYADNAAQGRTVRFSMVINGHYVSDEESKATGCTQLRIDIRGGTLRPETAKKILDLIREDGS